MRPSQAISLALLTAHIADGFMGKYAPPNVSTRRISSCPPLGGGFGSPGGSPSKGGKKKKKKKMGGGGSGGGPKSKPRLSQPEIRMEHIRRRVGEADFSPVTKLALGKDVTGQLALDIDPNVVAVVDNFIGEELITAMRAEAEALLPSMVPSQSTRWDEETQAVVPYEKQGVLSTQIEGGAAGYQQSPRLVEYIVTLTAHLSHKLNQLLPAAYQLTGEEQTNKLAVCLGEGSYYDKHLDNLGGTAEAGDRRKLTALLYLQPPGSHVGQPSYPHESVGDDPRGGYFRAYDVPERGDVTCIAPRGDRLIVFWSDALVHDVSPSFAPRNEADRRWALTIWFIADKTGVIRATDAAVEERHFSAATGIGKG